MKDKFNVLQELMKVNVMRDEFRVLVDNIGSYYVTGLEALKHNGYGWDFGGSSNTEELHDILVQNFIDRKIIS